MTRNKHLKRTGTFYVSSGKEIHGELTLKRDKSLLRLHSRDRFDPSGIEDFLHGTLLDLSKISLIKCVTAPVPGSSHGPRGQYYFAEVFPHFVLVGEQHLHPSKSKISAIHFVVDDATTLFCDYDAFSSVPDARPFIDQLVSAKKHTRDVATGPNPEIFYFTGKRQIFSADTVFGTVGATHNPGIRLAGSKGFRLRNRLFLSVTFREGVLFDESLRRLVHLRNFLGMMVGRPQNLKSIQIELQNANQDPEVLDVYWSLPPKRSQSSEAIKPHTGDILLDAVHYPELFSCLMTNWLVKQDAWNDARFRFFNSFDQQTHYDIDRFVGSANMFDVLPSGATPATVELSDDLQRAKAEAKRLFRALPPSAERLSVLNTLGRLGTSSLKHKVRHRAQLLLEPLGTLLIDIFVVTDAAIDCRNFYVHGGDPKLDYNRNFHVVVFFTQTLEFVFAASDLVEAGWDVRTWAQRPKGMTHPFGAYLLNYSDQLQAFRNVLRSNKSPSASASPSSNN